MSCTNEDTDSQSDKFYSCNDESSSDSGETERTEPVSVTSL